MGGEKTPEQLVVPEPLDRPHHRLTSLDGLRGVAALIVVLLHLSLRDKRIGGATGIDGIHSQFGSLHWWLTSTPLQFFIAGSQAVLVFFVLSGFVVALPVLRKKPFDWIAYYPQRTARLGLPALASLVLVIVLALVSNLIAFNPVWAYTLQWDSFVRSADLLVNLPILNTPLWTLRYELLFSFLLPLFVVAAVAVRRHWLLAALGCIAVSFFGGLAGAESFKFLPIFMLGCIIAVRVDSIRAWVELPTNAAKVRWGGPVLLVLSIVVLTLHATVWGLFPNKGRLQEWASNIDFVGAVGLVLVCAFWPPIARLLSTAVFKWLGRVSFSLYLIHIPILVFVDNTFEYIDPFVRAIIIGVSSLVLAEVFCRLVELPLHRASRRIGAYATAVWQGR